MNQTLTAGIKAVVDDFRVDGKTQYMVVEASRLGITIVGSVAPSFHGGT
jgi:hypothetical protein